MPRSPNDIATCQACDVNAQERTGDGIHGRSYGTSGEGGNHPI